MIFYSVKTKTKTEGFSHEMDNYALGSVEFGDSLGMVYPGHHRFFYKMIFPAETKPKIAL